MVFEMAVSEMEGRCADGGGEMSSPMVGLQSSDPGRCSRDDWTVQHTECARFVLHGRFEKVG